MIGSIVTAWWLWPRVDDDVVAVHAQSDVAPVAAMHENDDAPAAPIEPPHQPPVGTASVVPAPSEVPEAAPMPMPARATDESTGEAPTDAAPPTDTAPLLPLPRMPGDTRLSSSSRFDAATKSWIVKAAFRVVAREHHVVAFYRKALTDQGLTVTFSQAPPAADGSVKTYLHGKSGRVHAQVGIAPRMDVLETRVWILWRTRA